MWEQHRVIASSALEELHCRREARLREMNEPGHYPPPDFGCPPPNSIQPFQQQPRSSGFHPNMWSWSETPSEPSWDYSHQAGWHHGAAAGFPPGCGNYRPKRPYGKYPVHQKTTSKLSVKKVAISRSNCTYMLCKCRVLLNLSVFRSKLASRWKPRWETELRSLHQPWQKG